MGQSFSTNTGLSALPEYDQSKDPAAYAEFLRMRNAFQALQAAIDGLGGAGGAVVTHSTGNLQSGRVIVAANNAGDITNISDGAAVAGNVLTWVGAGTPPIWAAGGGGGAKPEQFTGGTWLRPIAIVIPVSPIPWYSKKARTIKGVSILTEGGVGSCIVDIWKTPIGSYPPTVANSICAAALPTISAGRTYIDVTLTGWTTLISAGDTLYFTLQSSSTFTMVSVQIQFTEN